MGLRIEQDRGKTENEPFLSFSAFSRSILQQIGNFQGLYLHIQCVAFGIFQHHRRAMWRVEVS